MKSAAVRLAYRVVSRALDLLRVVFGGRRVGVRCVLVRDRHVLLVRHAYGDRGWMLPGGRMKAGESPEQAARREMAEELGLSPADWRVLASLETPGRRGGRTFYLGASPSGAPLQADRGQLTDVTWFDLGALAEGECPPGASAALRQVVSDRLVEWPVRS